MSPRPSGPGRPDKRSGGPSRGGPRRPGEGRFRSDRPADRSSDAPGGRPAFRGGDRSGDRPGSRFGARFGERLGGRFGERFRERFGERSSDRPADRFGGAPGDRPAERSGERRFESRRPGAGPRRSGPEGGERGGGLRRGGLQRRFERPGASRDGRIVRRPGPPAAGAADRHRWRDRESAEAAAGPQRPEEEAERFGQETPSDLIWGRHAAQAALESERPIHRIWCTAEMRHSPRFLQLLREAKASGVLVEEVSWARLGQITAGAVHQGIVLQMAAAETLDLPTLIEGCRELGEPPLLMAVDGLTDPHNLGAIVRSAESLGAHGLLLPQRRSAGLTGTVAKVAAGALEHLPVARVVNLNRSLETLKQEGYRVVGLAEEGSVSLSEADLEGPLVVVTGSEGSGLSMLTRRHCDQLVRIPLRGVTPSLNASVATALLLYEIARRGWMRGLTGQAPAPRILRPRMPAPAAEPPVTEPPAIDSLELEVEAGTSPVSEAAPESAAVSESSAAAESGAAAEAVAWDQVSPEAEGLPATIPWPDAALPEPVLVPEPEPSVAAGDQQPDGHPHGQPEGQVDSQVDAPRFDVDISL